MPRKCAIGTVKTIDRVDVALPLEHLRQVPPPARRHPAPDRLARRLVEDGLVGRAPRRGADSGRPSAARARRGRRRSSRPRPRSGSAPSATTATRRAGPGRASRSGRRRPRRAPSRAATTRACSRSGSRGRPPTRRRGSSALSRRDSIGSGDEGTVRGTSRWDRCYIMDRHRQCASPRAEVDAAFTRSGCLHRPRQRIRGGSARMPRRTGRASRQQGSLT